MNKEKRNKKICKRLVKEQAVVVVQDGEDENQLPILIERIAIKKTKIVDSWGIWFDEPLSDDTEEMALDSIIGYVVEGVGDLTGLSRHFKRVNPSYTKEEEEKIKQQVLSMLGLGPGNYYISEVSAITLKIQRI